MLAPSGDAERVLEVGKERCKCWSEIKGIKKEGCGEG